MSTPPGARRPAALAEPTAATVGETRVAAHLGPRRRRGASHGRCWQALGRPDALVALFGTVLGLGVCWPFLGGRPLFLLDWVSGPHPPLPSTGMLGLDGGLTAGAPAAIVLAVLVRSLGEWVTWLPLLAFFPIAALGAGRVCGGGRGARLSAATLYCVNPWVFNRIYAGHVTLLLGYALLPFATRSALEAVRRVRTSRSLRSLAPVLWWTGLTALTPHYAWIYGAVLLGAVVVARPWRPRLLAWLVACGALFTATSLYILLPHTATELPTRVGTTSLDLYKTTGDPHLGLFANVAGLYGFWRLGPGPVLPKDVVGGWPLLMLALLAVIVTGYVATLRRPTGLGGTDDPDPGHRRQLAGLLAGVGVAGYFLALGSQGPTGPLFTWAYDHVPFFAVMREPEKFLELTALAYAVGLGWGVERLAATTAASRRAAVLALTAGIGIALPLGYTPTIFDGLAGQLAPSTIPAAYARADRLMGNGPGRVLYLPWHLYEAQPFTGERVVATPGPSLFRRDVIAGDNVQVGKVQTQSTLRRSAYLGELVAAGSRLRHLGARVAPLGVKYVVLAKTVDFRSYGWLGHQRDLRLVLDTSTLEVWRNLAYRGVGLRPGASAPVRQQSLVAYDVPSGPSGMVVIDAAYQRGWELDGVAGRPTVEGNTSFRLASRAGGVAVFTPWRLVRLGGELAGAVVVLVALLVTLATAREVRRAPGRTAVRAVGAGSTA